MFVFLTGGEKAKVEERKHGLVRGWERCRIGVRSVRVCCAREGDHPAISLTRQSQTPSLSPVLPSFLPSVRPFPLSSHSTHTKARPSVGALWVLCVLCVPCMHERATVTPPPPPSQLYPAIPTTPPLPLRMWTSPCVRAVCVMCVGCVCDVSGRCVMCACCVWDVCGTQRPYQKRDAVQYCMFLHSTGPHPFASPSALVLAIRR